MFFDAKQIPDLTHLKTDICIIGGGAAGITLAREFDGSDLHVSLLESGGFELNERTQSLYHGINTGVPSFDVHVNRLRYFGGTTNHWAGHCRPLDPLDFEQRDWVPYSGWPIDRETLAPFYERAQSIVGLGPDQYEDLEFFTEELALPALPLDERRLKTAVYNQSPPTRFSPVYKKQLKLSKNVDIFLNANVTAIKKADDQDEIESVEITCIDGPSFNLSAQVFILATGGMENARILMLSERVNPDGLGINHSLVGKFFMDHILLRPGADISFSRENINLALYKKFHRIAGGQMFGVLASTETLVREEKLRNFRMHLVSGRPRFDRPIGRMSSIIDQAEDPQYVSAEQKPDFGSVALHLVLEPTPNPDSHISLNDSTLDILGQPQIVVNWQIDKDDLRSAHRALELAALEFGRMGLGRGFGELFRDKTQWPGNLEAGRHHCGTTRMSKNADEGVVDENCLCHGLNNLYVAGSSVFPTIGYANPTLTIVAMALRLADQLKENIAT